MRIQVIIIGAGASGLMAAITAARRGAHVYVIEHKEKAGKKIYATGNGKCNFTNLVQSKECYRSDDLDEACKTLKLFDVNQTLHFFEEIGIKMKERKGYCYPNSEQASSIVLALMLECQRLSVSFCYEEDFLELRKIKSGYEVITNHNRYEADNVILAMGGCASKVHGSDGSGISLAGKLGLNVVKPLPALVALKASDKFVKQLSGVRMEVSVSLFINNKQKTVESGEIIFTDYGISGIPIFQISRFASKALEQNQKVDIKLDLLPEFNQRETEKLLQKRFEMKERTFEECLNGLFHSKLNFNLLKLNRIQPTVQIKMVKDNKNAMLQELAQSIKEFTLHIIGTNPFEQAQVSCGGVKLTEIDPNTMECRKYKGLYLVGELLDVDGTCGGYNLQWAWTSGFVAGNNVNINQKVK